MCILGKTQEQYEELFSAVLRKCESLGFGVDTSFMVCYFAQAAFNAVVSVLGQHVSIRSCFYHLCQSRWRRVQELGLTTAYKTNDAIRHMCGMLDALAFLPIDDISNGLRYIQEAIPDGEYRFALESLVTYFDTTYINGALRRIQRPEETGGVKLHLRRMPPLFSPSLWNVHEATISGTVRTNNLCESCNHTFKHLVGNSHPSVWVVIQALQQDASMCSLTILQNACGNALVKRVKRATVKLQQRLQTLCTERRVNVKSTKEVLCAIGHSFVTIK